MRTVQFALGMILSLGLTTSWCADKAPVPLGGSPASNAHVAVLSGDQVIQILDQTVDWYRTLGVQQQNSSQPSDLLMFYANQQTANQVVALAFDIARANAELLSSEASAEAPEGHGASPAQALDTLESKLRTQREAIQSEMSADQQRANRMRSGEKDELVAKLAELQGELDMINARINLLDTMTQFVNESSAQMASANALKAHIDAIAASIPASGILTASNPSPAPTSSPPSKMKAPSPPILSTNRSTAEGSLGIWDLGAAVLQLHSKGSLIEAIDRRTAALEETFLKIRNPPLERLKSLSAQSDALSTQADSAHGEALKAVRNQLDTLAWLFQQTSAIFIPLSKEGVLLEQYRHNLENWREAVKHEYGAALKALGTRLAILIGMLAVVFAGAQVWRRLVLRFTVEPRRRYQLLLIQKLTLWTVVVAIVAFTFVTELSSFATFAGLITAGLAVAMQSVLVSIVGYFFLIGKYGLRVGDRVQIGTVTGEVIDLGLVRMHLLELNTQGALGATGRVVAFANSIVFQATNGLFRQIPGVNFTWHEATISLPEGSDYGALKERLLTALRQVVKENLEEIARQTKRIEATTASTSVGNVTPVVQLRFSPSGVEALVRYPVELQHEAEVDERVSQVLLRAVSPSPRPGT